MSHWPRSFHRAILPGCALLIVLCFVTLTRADPDLWGHVRFGEDIIDSTTIRLPDTYSFTSDKLWINHEWLTEIIMASAYRTAGDAGLVLLKLTIIALSLACVWRIVIGDGAGLRPAAIVTTLALGGILPRAQQVRPQLFSVLCFSVLVLLLRRAEKRPAALWLAPPLFAFWANVHGGWLVGCGTLVLWCGARTWTIRTEGAGYGRSLVILWSACTASLAATLINPYGPGLWLFLSQTVGLSRRFIAEWGPVTGGLTTFGVWSLFALLVIVALTRADRVSRLHAIVVPVFWGVAAFKVSRLDTFFALSTVGLLAPDLIRVFHQRARVEAPPQPSLRAQAVMGVLAVVTLAVTVPQLKNNLLCIDVHASSTMPESEAMEFVRNRQLTGRMVTFFDWGEYAIWHKPGDLRVSMDGRRETVYSERNVDLHLDMYLGKEKGLAYLDSLHADYVWVPKELPLASSLMKSPMWTPAYRGGRSIIFARRSLLPPGTPVQEGGPAQSRCFPGP
jgi:hypothetical protein